MDHHTVAAISLTGTCLDVLGSLYLAYDLLGGQNGSLRPLLGAKIDAAGDDGDAENADGDWSYPHLASFRPRFR